MLKDLKTLTDLSLDEWNVIVDDEEYKADEDVLKYAIILSPGKYRIEEENEEEINEMRELSGLEPTKMFTEQDEEIKSFKAMAGL